MNGEIDDNGYATVSDVIDRATAADLLTELEQAERRREEPAANRMYALRNLFETLPAIRRLAASVPVRRLVEPVLGAACVAVRAVYFDKLPEANWKVPWHQDLSVALAERRQTVAFGPWSRKSGMLHALAPASLLEGMLTVRLHLDDCFRSNGPLRVLPGSHRYGRLDPAQIAALRSQVPEVVCEIEQCGALLMRPLLLHASSPAETPMHRRVIHIEYAGASLPDGLAWRDIVPAEPGPG